MQFALVVTRTGVAPCLRVFVTLRIAQPVGFSLQQGVQRLLHTSSHDPVEVVLDPLVVNRDDIVQRTRCNVGPGGSFSLTWLRLATSSSARFGPPALPKCAKESVRHRTIQAARGDYTCFAFERPRASQSRNAGTVLAFIL